MSNSCYVSICIFRVEITVSVCVETTVRQKLSSDPTKEVVSKVNENVAPTPTLFFAHIEMPSTQSPVS